MKKQADREIRNRIIKSAKTDWKKFKFLQPEGFKELSEENYEKLKKSILKNNFVESFKVWEKKKGELFCLDGYHRCKVLSLLESEGYQVPGYFNADYLDCKNEKEAAKLVLIYSSIYATVTEDGIYEFINKFSFDIDSLLPEINIPDVNMNIFKDAPELDAGEQPKKNKCKCEKCGNEHAQAL